jgi:hypothetical protein
MTASRKNDTTALIRGIPGNLKNIGPHQGLAAGQNNHRLRKRSQRINRFKTLFGGQLIGIIAVAGRPPAVPAPQLAAPRDFPRDNTRVSSFGFQVHFLTR